MRDSTAVKLKAIAPDLLMGKLPEPCPTTVQRAIAILEVLADGEWHTATEISVSTGIGRKYARDILKICQDAWRLETDRGKGWRF